jgi:hypothetical protein
LQVNDAEPVITVNCVDGPCQGLQCMDVNSQRIIDRHTGLLGPHICHLSDHGTASYVDAHYHGGTDDDGQAAATDAQ